MAKHTEAEFRTWWNTFTSEVCNIHIGTNSTQLFNTPWSLNTDDAGGNVTMPYYPDFDDNDNIPARFWFDDQPDYEISITWEEMDEGNARGRNKLIRWLYMYFKWFINHWETVQFARAEVGKWATLGNMGTAFGPDAEDTFNWLTGLSEVYHNYDIHS
jgi:hypothetical protein